MIPEMPPLPLLAETDIGRVAASTKRMPMMPRAGEGLMALSSGRQISALEFARDMGIAFGEHREMEKIRKARLKARTKATERTLKARNSAYRKDTRRAQRNNVQRQKSNARWVARNFLGMGTDLYR